MARFAAICWIGVLGLGASPGVSGCRKKPADKRAPAVKRSPKHKHASERIVLLKGFDRKDRPNLTAHVLQASTLKVIKRVELALDTQVWLTQIGRCDYFRAQARHTKPRIYRLIPDNQLVRVRHGKVPAKCRGKAVRVSVTGHGDKVLLKIETGDTHKTLPLPRPPDLKPGWGSTRRAVLFNQARSALVLDQLRGAYVVPDLQKPVLKKLDLKKAGIPLTTIYLLTTDVASRAAFLVAWESRGGYEARSILSKLAPLGGHHKARLADLGPGAPDELLHLASEGVLLYRHNHKGELLIIDDRNGQIRHRVNLAPGDRSHKIRFTARVDGKTVALVGRELIDVAKGRVVAELPGRIGPAILSPDSKRFYYSVRSLPGSPSYLAIRTFDLAQRRVVSTVTLKKVGHVKILTFAEIKRMYLLPGDRLVVVGGDATGFMDHVHK